MKPRIRVVNAANAFLSVNDAKMYYNKCAYR